MRSLVLVCFCCWSAAAQAAQPEPVDAALQTAWQVNNNGQAEEALAARDAVRSLLQSVPSDEPRFGYWVQQVALLYQNGGHNAQARSILQEGLDRTAVLANAHPSRLPLLSAMGESWAQDGNLLKALGYLEQTAEAAAATPPPSAASGAPRAQVSPRFAVLSARICCGASTGPLSAYTRLAQLYLQLGRQEEVRAIALKIRVLAVGNPILLARFYEQFGPAEEAAALFRDSVAQASDPNAKAGALQELANLYNQEQRFGEAVAAMQQAIAVTQSSTNQGAPNQTAWMRQALAGYFQRAGQTDRADEVYAQILRDTQEGPQEPQMLSSYANFLAQTNRAAQGETLLKSYLDGHPELDDSQQMTLLYGLANTARQGGNSQLANEYQHAAQARQPRPPVGVDRVRIGDDLQKALAAVQQNRLDDAFTLALRAIDAAPGAEDGRQVGWMLPQIANALAGREQPGRAEQLFERLFGVVETWSQSDVQPMIQAAQSYVQYLIGRPDRAADVPAAIERYRAILIEANGPESARMLEVLRTTIQFERTHSETDRAIASAQELLRLQESFSGNTSEFYLNDLQFAAGVYQSTGDAAGALPLLRRAVTIADAIAFPPQGDYRRASTRMALAQVLAVLHQFDEAEALGQEAVTLQKNLAPELAQIQRMRTSTK